MTPIKKIFSLSGLMLSVLFCLLAVPQTQAAETQDVLLSSLEARYAKKSFSAEFSQTARLAALDITEKASGKAWFSHPGKMKWQYLSPDRHDIITNGVQLWIYRPDENQVMTGRAAAFFKPGTGSAFLSDITRIRESFAIKTGRQEKDLAELVLTPKTETPDLARAVITLALPSHEIQMVTTENIYGDTTQFIFSNIRFNAADPAMFNFTIPDGTSVIEMDQ